MQRILCVFIHFVKEFVVSRQFDMSSDHFAQCEPDWIAASGYTEPSQGDCAAQLLAASNESAESLAATEPEPIMQTDHLKTFYLDIVKYGLQYAYQKCVLKDGATAEVLENFKAPSPQSKTAKPKKVVIVGAGLSGLVAGYELVRAGHNVQILEMQHRVGGRIKTVSSESFYPGLWSDAGGMRLPGGINEEVENKHYLTNAYVQLFGLKKIPFLNASENGYYHLYGKNYQISEWKKNSAENCSLLWPGWDKNLTPEIMDKYEISGIDTYYDACIKPVKDEIQNASGGNPTSSDWTNWSNRWSRFSGTEFLTSSYDAIIERLKIGSKEDLSASFKESLEPLKYLLPWNESAMIGFLAYNYTPGLSTSLVELLRDDLGQWWHTPMHTLEGGLSSLPWAFTKKTNEVELETKFKFGMFVTNVKYEITQPKVWVTARNDTFSQEVENIEGDVAIITLPLNIIRQVRFSPPLEPGFADALMNISYSPSTKILLQCKERFWEKEGIYGGFSFTTLPIGQLHYPSNPDKTEGGRGVLMCYTWKQEGLLFGSQPKQMAIAEAVDEISDIHPEIKKHFEVGAIQAWYSDPTAQGAFANLLPYQKKLIDEYLLYPYPKPKLSKEAFPPPPPPPPPLYFAGEAISYSNGWIQGALESGLRAAYQFYCRNECYDGQKN